MTSDLPSSDARRPESSPQEPSAAPGPDQRRSLLAFVLPLAVYMLLGSLEPDPPPVAAGAGEVADADDLIPVDELDDAPPIGGEEFTETDPAATNWLGIPGSYYPVVYTFRIIVTLAVLAWFMPVYLQWPLRVSPLALAVGVVGVVLWIGCTWLDLEGQLVHWLGEDHVAISWLGLGPRPAYNPLAALGDSPLLAYAFLAVRFFGLALLVPVIEEAFLRAWLMRFVMHDNWTSIPFGTVNRLAVAVGILVPVLYHPEKLAALVWFALVTWLMVRTKNFWDCVAAHMVTNLLLGIYIVTQGTWHLW